MRGDSIVSFKIELDGTGSITKSRVNDNGSMRDDIVIRLSYDEVQMLCHLIHTNTKREK